MANPELPLTIISANQGSVTRWRAEQDVLLGRHQREFRQLSEERMAQETDLSVGILQAVCDMCEGGLNERFKQLDDLSGGFSVQAENVKETWNRPRIEPLVQIKPFLEVAQELKGTKAGKFFKDVFTRFEEQSHDIPKDHIRIIGVHSSQNRGERLGGMVMLCDTNRGGVPRDNHIQVGFDVFFMKEGKLPEVRIRDAQFFERVFRPPSEPGSFHERFARMLLSEQVAVVGALFVASDIAVTEVLLERHVNDRASSHSQT